MNNKNNYEIMVGKFDNKFGPYCLKLNKKKELCAFSNKVCNGFNCSLIVDAINTREDNVVFEFDQEYFQCLKVTRENPEKRGGIEKYVILIKIHKGLGLIKEEIVDEIVNDFKNVYTTNNLIFDEVNCSEFAKKWEAKFKNILSSSNITDETYFFREKLNSVVGNLELYIASTQEKINSTERQFVSEALIAANEIVHYLDEKRNKSK